MWTLIAMQDTGMDVGGIERSSLINFKDINNLLDSPLFQQNAGATNPLAFQPTVSYETVALPQRPLFNQYSQAPTGTIENAISLFFQENPHSPSKVMSEMEAFIKTDKYKTYNPQFAERLNNESVDGEVVAEELASIKGQVDDLASEARSYNTEYAALDPEAQAAADGGLPSYQKATETPSEASKQYTDRGFSTPDERYTQADFYDFGHIGPDGLRDGNVAQAAATEALYQAMKRRRSGLDGPEMPDAWVDPRERVAEPFGPSGGGGFGLSDLMPQWGASPDALRGDDVPNDAQRVIEAAIAKSRGNEAPNQNLPLPGLDPSTLDPRGTSDGLPSFGGPRGRGVGEPDGRGRVRSDEDQRLESVQAARWAANIGPLVQKKVWDRELTDEEKAARDLNARARYGVGGERNVQQAEYEEWAKAISPTNIVNHLGVQWNNEDNIIAQRSLARSRAERDAANSMAQLNSRNSVGATPLTDQVRAAIGAAPLLPSRPAPQARQQASGAASDALWRQLAARRGR